MGKSESKNLNDHSLAMRVSTVSIVINLVLSALKLSAGIIAKSGAMISDAIHSASDILSTIIVMFGVTFAGKKSDREHPYGHERMECVASIILATILFATGFAVGISGLEKIASGNYDALQMPGKLAMAAAVLSIIVKEWMYWYTRAAAKKIKSGALMADAWHHRSDALSSIGAFIGIFGARLGYKVLDPIASVVICVFIVKVAYDIFKDSIDKMVDKSCDLETLKEIEGVTASIIGVGGIDEIKTRLFGSKIYVEIEIACDADMKLSEAHGVAQSVHDEIEEKINGVKHCMVHVNPIDNEENE